MKKLIVILMCTITLLSVFLPVSAYEPTWEEDFKEGIGSIALPYGTPVIDGTINSDEGWSGMQVIDKANTDGGWGGEDVTISGELYRAYDENNLYIASIINIEEYSLCEDFDWIDGDSLGNIPGWDGDVFVLSIDPLKALLNEGFGNDPAIWYGIGLFEGGKVRVYRSHINDGEISDVCSGAGAVTDTGWLFEVSIPWETICKDLNDMSFGMTQVTTEDILKEGNEISAAMIYYDRRYDPEAESRITYSRYITIATVLPDGTPGILATPWKLQAHGIFMTIEENDEIEVDAPVDSSKGTEVLPDDTDNFITGDLTSETNPMVSSTASGKNDKATTKSQGTSSSTGSGAPQTLDMTLAIAVGTLIISAIAVVFFKKKNRTI
ncbi:MAG: hypothetical protein E7652_08865 [Ruminococcaceae bacterium]|nr:hypothetical protein [Oscillospiraceae bacterium]